MKTSRSRNTAFALLLSLAAGLSCTFAAMPAVAQDAAASAPDPTKQVSPEVGNPVKEAQALIQEKKFAEANAKLDSIVKEPKTPYETYVINRTRLAIASLSNDDKTAADILPRLIDSPETPVGDKPKLMQAAATLAARREDFKQAIVWQQRYFKEGGGAADAKAHDDMVRFYYLDKDYVHAGEELKANLDALEKSGATPTENQFKLLYSIAALQKDQAGVIAALEKTVKYYPKKEYYVALLQSVRNKPGFADRNLLDYLRLKYQMGVMDSPKEYAALADLDMRAGYATEARKALDAGYKAKFIGEGAEFADQKQLMAQAVKESATESSQIAHTESEVRKSKDGLGLVNVGYSYIGLEQYDKGLEMMEQGVKGSLKRPEEAKLHLGMAYAMAGQKEKAIDVFKNVQGGDGTADLAHLWIVYLNNPIH